MEQSSSNITEVISQTINTLISQLLSSIDNQLYTILDDLAFLTGDIMNDSGLEKILGTDFSNGILLICNALVIGFLLYYAVSSFFSYFTFSPTTRPLPFLFRAIIFTILMNFSYFFCEQIIHLISSLSTAICELGEHLFQENISFSSLISEFNSKVYTENSTFDFFTFEGLLRGFTSISLFYLIFSFSFRYIMVKFFVLLCPFAILCLIHEKTSFFFSAWMRGFLSLLILQVFVALLLVLFFSLSFATNDLMYQILYFGAFLALTRANGIVKELLGGISIDVSSHVSSLKSFFTIK